MRDVEKHTAQDTNVVLDYLSASRPRHFDAVDFFSRVFDGGDIEPVVLAGSLKDVYYIMCRAYKNRDVVRRRLDDFRDVVSVYDLSGKVLDAAFVCDEPDLEDAIVRASAELMGAKAIITRDARAFRGSSVPSMDAREFVLSCE